jgi:hypothetical protein
LTHAQGLDILYLPSNDGKKIGGTEMITLNNFNAVKDEYKEQAEIWIESGGKMKDFVFDVSKIEMSVMVLLTLHAAGWKDRKCFHNKVKFSDQQQEKMSLHYKTIFKQKNKEVKTCELGFVYIDSMLIAG